MESNLPLLSVVIPFYNEQACVCDVCTEVNAVLSPGLSGRWELIMVNDGSTDRTGELMNAMAARFSHFRAIHLHPNSGQSAAMDAGFRAARGEVIGTMDGDGQNDPRDFPILLQAMADQRVNMMCGIRQKRSDSSIRKISSRIANRIRAAVLNDGISDVGCSLRVFRRTCLERICFFKNAHRFFPALVQMAGCSVSELPVRHRPRMAGESRYGGGIRSRLFAGLIDLLGVYWVKKRFLRYAVTEHQNTALSLCSHPISKDKACSA
ncbi:MAG: glycosyltransferase family 2 protein [Desulfobacteraceae bacterium]